MGFLLLLFTVLAVTVILSVFYRILFISASRFVYNGNVLKKG
ncbi:hypothetical protein CHCC20488_2042 [Bacillus paralicheniformis]|uniref:Uncharacterized protein n=1 Tax=Bacillus paralicheniformis TaxID=1648923 RepID=A0ABY3G0I5_9BACI|nr:hypothetical protein SC10_B2orf04900 [Bacillus paralicheniformis]TWJ49648.1 hypothetical protein CHCC5023_1831 [Bacillus paralicheniformis]TWJ74169.1 hypothetical protein CHCC20497_3254 [Bacillus paralicheniformis]TWJ77602.1 hypothetical protein CHCC5019_3078 [Bacillus paralicheniformis]TWK49499.1 hypothetical protein CHCC20347_1782 [Bacillus paralicheniformis]